MTKLTIHEDTTASNDWLKQGFLINADSVEETLEQSGLNWTVSKRPLLTLNNSEIKKAYPDGIVHIKVLRGRTFSLIRNPSDTELQQEVGDLLRKTMESFLPLKNHFSIVRDDTKVPLGVAGNVYQVLNNIDCIKMLEPLLKDGKITIVRAGMFNDGANCWVIAKFPDSITVGTDTLDQYMKISWSHDGTEKLSATFIALLQRTNTQINPPIRGSNVSIEIRHTTNALERIELAQTLLHKGKKYFDALEEELTKLVGTPWTDKDMEEYLEALIPNSKVTNNNSRSLQRRNRILEIFQNTDDQIGHTKYAGFEAVCEFCDHEKSVRITDKDENDSDKDAEKKEIEARCQSVWRKSGSGQKMKNTAYRLIGQ